MLFAKQLPTFPAVHVPIDPTKPFPTHWIRTGVIGVVSLPMLPRDELIRIYDSRNGWFGSRGSAVGGDASTGRGSALLIRLENIQTLEFLIEYRQGLELFGFDDLTLEPIFDFILFNILQVPVGVVEMAIKVSVRIGATTRTVRAIPVEL